MKHFTKWTHSQKLRAAILFEQYPAIKEAYDISMELTRIYNQRISKNVAMTKPVRWYEQVERLDLKYFKSGMETMQKLSNNYQLL